MELLVPFGWSLVLTAAHTMVNNYMIEIFLWAVMADLLTGIMKSFTGHAKVKVDSSTGLRGLAKALTSYAASPYDLSNFGRTAIRCDFECSRPFLYR